MLLLAANIAWTLATTGQLSQAESQTWSKLRPSVGTLSNKGLAMGPVAFISNDGYAIANSMLVQRGATEIVTSAGIAYKFQVESTDVASQLSLLKTSAPPIGVVAAQVADASDGQSGPILAVLTNGVLRAELGNGMKIGIDQKTRRTFPIQEIRVEQPVSQMGGALLFSRNGRLIGAFFASLPQQNLNSQQQTLSTGNQSQEANQLKILSYNQANSRNLGPQGLVVGYTPTWEVTSKAVTGFLSPEKRPQYGLLGVFVKDNKVSGVEITEIQKGTGAESAGLQAGDIIIGINGLAIRTQVDFSRATYRLIPGSIVTVSYQRNGTNATAQVTIGSQLAEVDGHQQSATVSTDSLENR